jgi:hypothetical protein
MLQYTAEARGLLLGTRLPHLALLAQVCRGLLALLLLDQAASLPASQLSCSWSCQTWKGRSRRQHRQAWWHLQGGRQQAAPPSHTLCSSVQQLLHL